MILLGVFFNLLCAFMHGVGFVMNRRYVVARHTTAIRLLVISHTWMGLFAVVGLLIMRPDLPGWDVLAEPTINAVWPYMAAQCFFFLALRRTDASRLSPLLGLKIVAVAALYVIWLGEPLHALEWVAVIIAVVSAFALNYTGGKLPPIVVAYILATVTLFSISDVNIRRGLDILAPLGTYRAPVVLGMLYYVVAGAMSVCALPWLGSRQWADWRAAVPYSALWITSIVVMFIGFAMAGIVLGNIALATRGLWSILIGMIIAHRGHHHLETRVSRATNIRRAVAATAMIVAIGLFVAV